MKKRFKIIYLMLFLLILIFASNAFTVYASQEEYIKLDSLSHAEFEYFDGQKNGLRITAQSDEKILAQYESPLKVGYTEMDIRVEVLDEAMFENACIRLYVNDGNRFMILEVYSSDGRLRGDLYLENSIDSKENLILEKRIAFAENLTDNGRENVLCFSVEQVKDYLILNKLNHVIQINTLGTELSEGEDKEKELIDFLNSGKEFSVGICVMKNSGEEAGADLKILQMGKSIYYGYEIFDLENLTPKNNVQHSKIYLIWKNPELDFACPMVLERYVVQNNQTVKTFEITFLSTVRDNYVDTGLSQATQYEYRIKYIDSQDLKVPKIIAEGRNLVFKTRDGSISYMFYMIIGFAVVVTGIVLFYVYLPQIKKLLYKNKGEK